MKRAAPLNTRTVLGTGKADELAGLVQKNGADVVVFCNPLTPTQRRALEVLTEAEIISFPNTKRETKNAAVVVSGLPKLKHAAETNANSPYVQYNGWLADFKSALSIHLQGVSYYRAEYYTSSNKMLASSVPLLSAYDTLDALDRGFGYPESDTKEEGFPKRDVKDEEELNRKMEDLRLRLIEIIYGIEKEGGHLNENRYYKG